MTEAHQTDIAIHRAAQYLSSFGKNYLAAKPDDSHTNLLWNDKDSSFESRMTKNGQFAVLSLKDFSLTWKGVRDLRLGLTGRSHGEIVTWLHHCAIHQGMEEYDFYLHYKLDSGKLEPDQVYPALDEERLRQTISYRDLAQKACLSIKEYFDLRTEIRVWPHHFDTGGFEKREGVDIGFGLAFPDKMIDEYYLYVSGYQEDGAVDPKEFSSLDQGRWVSSDFKGAVMPIAGREGDRCVDFLKQAIDTLLRT